MRISRNADISAITIASRRRLSLSRVCCETSQTVLLYKRRLPLSDYRSQLPSSRRRRAATALSSLQHGGDARIMKYYARHIAECDKTLTAPIISMTMGRRARRQRRQIAQVGAARNGVEMAAFIASVSAACASIAHRPLIGASASAGASRRSRFHCLNRQHAHTKTIAENRETNARRWPLSPLMEML